MTATSGTGPVEVAGGDAQLADAAHVDARIRFDADTSCDLARALGVSEQLRRVRVATPVDVLHLGPHERAVNMVVVGVAPDRLRWWHRSAPCRVAVDGRVVHEGVATTVLVANGEYLRGLDVVPRGHPSDGRLEVHVYALAPTQRRPMRRRLATGTHVPHPDITTAQGERATLHWDRRVSVEVDGVSRPRLTDLEVRLGAGEVILVP